MPPTCETTATLSKQYSFPSKMLCVTWGVAEIAGSILAQLQRICVYSISAQKLNRAQRRIGMGITISGEGYNDR